MFCCASALIIIAIYILLAGDSLQIALFYVANDVCQKAKKKGGSHVLLQAFAPHWVNAISYSRYFFFEINFKWLKLLEKVWETILCFLLMLLLSD